MMAIERQSELLQSAGGTSLYIVAVVRLVVGDREVGQVT